MTKSLTCLFLSLILCCGFFFSFNVFCVVQASADANETSSPSVPEFTLKYVDYSYDVPPTYGIDQFSGEQIVTKEGYHVDERTIEFTIKNQAFTPHEDADGNNIILYYNIRFKGPYGTEWLDYPDRSHTWGGFPRFFFQTLQLQTQITRLLQLRQQT